MTETPAKRSQHSNTTYPNIVGPTFWRLKQFTRKHWRELEWILSSQLMLRGINNLRLVKMITPFRQLEFKCSSLFSFQCSVSWYLANSTCTLFGNNYTSALPCYPVPQQKAISRTWIKRIILNRVNFMWFFKKGKVTGASDCESLAIIFYSEHVETKKHNH